MDLHFRKRHNGIAATGSGKSICYQLVCGSCNQLLSFVVCPIKSLMYDQKADLDSTAGFTRSNFPYSDLKAGEGQSSEIFRT